MFLYIIFIYLYRLSKRRHGTRITVAPGTIDKQTHPFSFVQYLVVFACPPRSASRCSWRASTMSQQSRSIAIQFVDIKKHDTIDCLHFFSFEHILTSVQSLRSACSEAFLSEIERRDRGSGGRSQSSCSRSYRR